MTHAERTRMGALIVEDDRGQSELGALMLEEFDLEVSQVQTAEEALDHLRDCGGSVAVLVADVNLPGLINGVGLVQRVSVLWPTISVIVTSGDTYTGDDLPESCVFVPKPWRALDIVAAAERAARSDHSLRALRL